MMALMIYPNMKGYIDALKIVKQIEEKDGNAGPILREIEKVLLHEQTTEQMMQKLKIDEFGCRQIIKERCRQI